MSEDDNTDDPGDAEEDLFERLDAGDREGDPLEQFGTAPDAAGGGEADHPDGVGEEGSLGDTGGEDPLDDLDGEDPFGDLGDREGDPFGSAESAFERMDVDGLDPDAVWESLAEAEARGSVTERDDGVYAEVSKHSFCEQCEYFSEPPDATCTHEGTQIIEFLDMETVRVFDCPVVEQRRELHEQS